MPATATKPRAVPPMSKPDPKRRAELRAAQADVCAQVPREVKLVEELQADRRREDG